MNWLRRLFGRIAPAPPAPVPEPVVAAPSVPQAAVDMVASFEGWEPVAYLCPAKVWTIGYGTTRWPGGVPVKQGDGPISEKTGRDLLRRDLVEAARAVDDLVTVALTENQRAALISFVHNVGRGAFSRSTLLRELNAGRHLSAATEFARWNRGGGRVLSGLIRRRAAEEALFRK